MTISETAGQRAMFGGRGQSKDAGEGKLVGYIRIRSTTQGIALSLGDKITLKQKG